MKVYSWVVVQHTEDVSADSKYVGHAHISTPQVSYIQLVMSRNRSSEFWGRVLCFFKTIHPSNPSIHPSIQSNPIFRFCFRSCQQWRLPSSRAKTVAEENPVKEWLQTYRRILSVQSVWMCLTTYLTWTFACTNSVSAVFRSGRRTKPSALYANNHLIQSTTV